MPEVALLVGELGRERPAVQIKDAVVGIAGIVLRHRVDQRRADIGAGAVHHERNVLVGHALERDQRFGRLQLVVERDQLELAAERAARGVFPRDDKLENLQELVAARGERAGERIGIGELDRLFGQNRPAGKQQTKDSKRIAKQPQTAHDVLPYALSLFG